MESIRQDLSRCKIAWERSRWLRDKPLPRWLGGRGTYLKRGVSDRKSVWSGCSSLLANLIYNFTFAFCILPHGLDTVARSCVTAGLCNVRYPAGRKDGEKCARDSLWGTTLNLCRDLWTYGADTDETTKTMFRCRRALESFWTCLQFIFRVILEVERVPSYSR